MTVCPRPDKQRFATKRAAKRVLACWRGPASGLHVYRCACGQYHIGHKRGGTLGVYIEVRR